jgi:adenosylcobinamide-phosphate synthase
MTTDLENRLLLLVAGLLLDAIFGDMPALFRHVPHPVAIAGRAIAAFDKKLNRERRGGAVRRVRGIVTVVVLVAAAYGLGWGIERACGMHPAGIAVEAFAVGILLAQRSLFDHVSAVAQALDHGGTTAGRDAVRHIVGRDPMQLDRHGVARAAIESLAENFSDGVVAPAFWFLVLGLPGLVAYKMANTLDSMIGHRSRRHRYFGWAAARFDDLLNLVPARLSGLLLATAALFGRESHIAPALGVMLRDAHKHRSPNAGWPESAMAGALGLSLAGPRAYAEGLVVDPWLGRGTNRVVSAHIVQALHLYRAACVMLGALLCGAWLAIHFRLIG